MKEEFEVTDKELADAFKGTNFGSAEPREVMKDTLLKCAGGYCTGYTAERISIGLGLTTVKWKLTKRGKEVLYRSFCMHIKH